ncbi:MAG: hypothetical protein IIC73_01515 [Armatimonadetes bacterium]|nr:hypothetical protein [Armatimonadota bacterium]
MREDGSTRKVVDGSRTHFIEVKRNEDGSYLALTELDSSGDRRRLIVSAEHASEYLRELQDAVSELEGEADRPLEGRAYQPWSDEEDERLRRAADAGLAVEQMAKLHERNTGAINSRLKKLGIERAT